jgi:hypothetical protein
MSFKQKVINKCDANGELANDKVQIKKVGEMKCDSIHLFKVILNGQELLQNISKALLFVP